MAANRLTVLITPSATGLAWRGALIDHVTRSGWTYADVGPEGPEDGASGLFFAHSHTAVLPNQGPCAIIIDTTAVGQADPSSPADGAELAARSDSLVEAEMAARIGASVLNGARYRLDLPGIGIVERPEGHAYRIPLDASESPLALFESMPIPPTAAASWNPRWFTYPDRGETAAASTWIDMTGRMRPLLYGPYIRLPAGRWSVDVRFAVDPERAHAPLLFEWGSGTEFCRIMGEIRHPGSYGIRLDRIWPEAAAAQLRIWNYHPVFQGRLDFQGCQVSRVADDEPSPPTPTDRIVELGVI